MNNSRVPTQHLQGFDVLYRTEELGLVELRQRTSEFFTDEFIADTMNIRNSDGDLFVENLGDLKNELGLGVMVGLGEDGAIYVSFAVNRDGLDSTNGVYAIADQTQPNEVPAIYQATLHIANLIKQRSLTAEPGDPFYDKQIVFTGSEMASPLAMAAAQATGEATATFPGAMSLGGQENRLFHYAQENGIKWV